MLRMTWTLMDTNVELVLEVLGEKEWHAKHAKVGEKQVRKDRKGEIRL